MSRLVLKGHATRGKEVINLLEMLGANRLGYKDTFVGFYYYIECEAIVSSDECPIDAKVFTLEQFEEKYPYKVGDVVDYYVGMLLEKETHIIIGMQWDSNKCRILYHLDNCDVIDVRSILYSIEYKTEQSKQKRIKDMDLKNYGTATIKYIQEDGSKDMELIIPHNQEIVNIDGRYILRDKKPQYPKTYDECLKILGYNIAHIIPMNHGHNGLLMMKLQRLLIFRDAYWKIAGEQMGLDKPWEPDFTNNDEERYGIYTLANKVERDFCGVGDVNMVLSFPTEEMRDAFYEDFKELVEQCKELL